MWQDVEDKSSVQLPEAQTFLFGLAAQSDLSVGSVLTQTSLQPLVGDSTFAQLHTACCGAGHKGKFHSMMGDGQETTAEFWDTEDCGCRGHS